MFHYFVAYFVGVSRLIGGLVWGYGILFVVAFQAFYLVGSEEKRVGVGMYSDYFSVSCFVSLVSLC